MTLSNQKMMAAISMKNYSCSRNDMFIDENIRDLQ